MTPPPAEQFAARVFLGPTLRAQPDRRLVGLVRDGYDAAFEEIVRRYRRPLDRFAAAMVGGRSEDVTQDAFSKALLTLRGSEAEIELRPWLYRIVRNTALNDLRDRGPIAEELAETLPGGLSAAAEVEAREELRDLMERLRALPDPQRAALVMRELEGLSHEEIAAALGVSGGAARQTIFRARAALREGFGLLLPLPIVRALAEHGDDAARAGGALAGASSAGGAALGGFGGGALKAGMAAVLIAGTVGAGVAIDHHGGDRPGPEAAEAATLPRASQSGSRSAAGGSDAGAVRHGTEDRHGGFHSGDDNGGEDRSGPGGGGSLDDGDRSGPNDVSGHSGSGSGGSGDDDRHGDSSPNSGPGSISGGHGSDDSGGDDHGGSSGSGSDDGGFDDHGGTSGGSGDDGTLESGSGGGSGPGSGEIEPAPELEPEPVIEDGDSRGSGSDSGSSGSSGSGSGDLSGVDTTDFDG
jgi:RNA polymerase sigma factor (sigma-70 family)